MRAWAIAASVVVLLGWLSILITPAPTPPMGFEHYVDWWRMLQVTALSVCSLIAVAALLATRRV